jgi:hypothetical protein
MQMQILRLWAREARPSLRMTSKNKSKSNGKSKCNGKSKSNCKGKCNGKGKCNCKSNRRSFDCGRAKRALRSG